MARGRSCGKFPVFRLCSATAEELEELAKYCLEAGYEVLSKGRI